jgi:hypothetical protein
MVDLLSRLADLNIDALLAALEADAAAQLASPCAVSSGHAAERRSARRLDRDALSGNVHLMIPGVAHVRF